MGWFYIGEEYRRKALEHAALVEAEDESTDLLNSIRELLNPIRDSAIESAYGVRPETITEVEEKQFPKMTLKRLLLMKKLGLRKKKRVTKYIWLYF
jgi:hypothetical protein